jgi:hypothetical protein
LYQPPSQSSHLPPSFRFPPLREGNRAAHPFGSPCSQGEPCGGGRQLLFFCELWLGDWYNMYPIYLQETIVVAGRCSPLRDTTAQWVARLGLRPRHQESFSVALRCLVATGASPMNASKQRFPVDSPLRRATAHNATFFTLPQPNTPAYTARQRASCATATTAARYNNRRTRPRPPPIRAYPRQRPLSRRPGAKPANAAITLRDT